MVMGVVSVLESELESSKVTCLWGCMGLVKGAHLLAASSGQTASEVVCPCDSFYAFYSQSILYFLTTSDCPIALGYHATHERWISSSALCVPLTWLPWPVPSSEHPLLPLGLPTSTPAACPGSGQSGHRSPVSGH